VLGFGALVLAVVFTTLFRPALVMGPRRSHTMMKTPVVLKSHASCLIRGHHQTPTELTHARAGPQSFCRSASLLSPTALPGIRGVPSHRGPPKRALVSDYIRARAGEGWGFGAYFASSGSPTALPGIRGVPSHRRPA
jgi:hypothetical protein